MQQPKALSLEKYSHLRFSSDKFLVALRWPQFRNG
jgi:hypothetical protein